MVSIPEAPVPQGLSFPGVSSQAAASKEAHEALYKVRLARGKKMVFQKLAQRNNHLVRANNQVTEENERLMMIVASLMHDIHE